MHEEGQVVPALGAFAVLACLANRLCFRLHNVQAVSPVREKRRKAATRFGDKSHKYPGPARLTTGIWREYHDPDENNR